MVRGLDIFKKYFEQYPDNYLIIGGTACDMIISDAGFTPRVTKDIDIILVIEALSADFVRQFWKFIQEGNYERQEKSADHRKYYRFVKPENLTFPFQIELFSRKPDLIELDEFAHLTPIPADDDLSSLSAILLNDDYYHFILEHSTFDNGIHRANTEALICLKAKAWLEITERIANGGKEDRKQINKHKADIFRLAVMLAKSEVFILPETISIHLKTFVQSIQDDLPNNSVFREMGLENMDSEKAFERLIKSFKLFLR